MLETAGPRLGQRTRRTSQDPDFVYENNIESDRSSIQQQDNVPEVLESEIEKIRRQNRERQRAYRQRKREASAAQSDAGIEKVRRQNRERKRAYRQRKKEALAAQSDAKIENIRCQNREQQRISCQRRKEAEVEENDVVDPFDAAAHENKSNICKGPTVICVCCGGLWFPNQIETVTKESLLERNADQDFVDTVFKVDQDQGSNKFCFNCSVDVKKIKIPKIRI